jgi:hypothetical protein
MADGISYVGLDVHKDGIVVAIADSGLRGEVRDYGGSRTRRRHGNAWYVNWVAMARPCDFAMRRGRAAMAFSVSCRGTGTNASWLPRR